VRCTRRLVGRSVGCRQTDRRYPLLGRVVLITLPFPRYHARHTLPSAMFTKRIECALSPLVADADRINNNNNISTSRFFFDASCARKCSWCLAANLSFVGDHFVSQPPPPRAPSMIIPVLLFYRYAQPAAAVCDWIESCNVYSGKILLFTPTSALSFWIYVCII